MNKLRAETHERPQYRGRRTRALPRSRFASEGRGVVVGRRTLMAETRRLLRMSSDLRGAETSQISAGLWRAPRGVGAPPLSMHPRWSA